jgi:PncC family amidohydrolase
MPDSLEQTLGQLLIQRQLSLAVAESCTGGLVGHRLTNVAGSSAYFMGGVIAYDNRIKQALLGVCPATLEQHGAVSAQVALEMARGLRLNLHVDVGLSITGIAGPGGATEAKPVGLAYIGLVAPGLERVKRCQYAGDRLANKVAFAATALRLTFAWLHAA